jgi:hypothetical protein
MVDRGSTQVSAAQGQIPGLPEPGAAGSKMSHSRDEHPASAQQRPM